MNTTTNLGTSWALAGPGQRRPAQTKERSRWYWFLFSLFLGPLATLVIVVWPPRTAKATGTSTQPAGPTGA